MYNKNQIKISLVYYHYLLDDFSIQKILELLLDSYLYDLHRYNDDNIYVERMNNLIDLFNQNINLSNKEKADAENFWNNQFTDIAETTSNDTITTSEFSIPLKDHRMTSKSILVNLLYSIIKNTTIRIFKIITSGRNSSIFQNSFSLGMKNQIIYLNLSKLDLFQSRKKIFCDINSLIDTALEFEYHGIDKKINKIWNKTLTIGINDQIDFNKIKFKMSKFNLNLSNFKYDWSWNYTDSINIEIGNNLKYKFNTSLIDINDIKNIKKDLND